MIAMNESTTIGQIVTDNLEAAAVLERLHLDYCCGGKQTLKEACQKKGLSFDDVLSQLQRLKPMDTAQPRLSDWSLTELCDHIVATHHQYIRESVPRLTQLIDKVSRVHGERNPKLIEVKRVFSGLVAELIPHMMKEEHVLFPFCRQLDVATEQPQFHCGSVQGPIHVMEAEHEHAGEALSMLRYLSSDYTPPEWACQTYRVMLFELERFEADMHRHVHKENEILYPKALLREQSLQSQ